MAKEIDFFGEIAPRHLDADMRTVMLARWAARQAAMTLSEEIGAVMVEMLAGLRDAGVLDDAATAAVILRWKQAFASWKLGDGTPSRAVMMATAITEELPWCVPDLVPSHDGRPTRHGRKRRPKSRLTD